MRSARRRLNTAPESPEGPLIVLTGGGSGGHITPLLAIADEIKKREPQSQLIFIGQRGDQLIDLPSNHKSISKVYTIRAGKFRRYHKAGIKQIFDVGTLLKNLRDVVYVVIGFFQAYRLLGRLKPNVIFIKGGFVGVPIGLAAAIRRIPYITHDSDAVPGLANRIIGKWASAHAVALPKTIYKYQQSKTFTVGVPVSNKFRPVNSELQLKYKQQLGFTDRNKILFVTGGGMGAQRLNQAVASVMPKLLKLHGNLVCIHLSGRDHEEFVNKRYDDLLTPSERSRVRVKGFIVDDLYLNSGAADVIITRAGATTLAEFATQSKCCVIIPNPQLTGGHQTKNAQYLEEQDAAIVIDESSDNINAKLQHAINELLNSSSKRNKLAQNLASFARPRASKDLSELILDTIRQ